MNVRPNLGTTVHRGWRSSTFVAHESHSKNSKSKSWLTGHGAERRYERRGPERGYERRGPERGYERRGPERGYERRGPERGYEYDFCLVAHNDMQILDSEI